MSDYLSDVFSGKKKNASRATLGNPQAVNADGLLMDVNVQPVNNNLSMHEDKRQDVDHIFSPAFNKTVKGKVKKYQSCKICLCVLALSYCLIY